MSLVNRIQKLCSRENTTLIGLEREIGLGRGTIRNWNSSSPSVDKLQKVANYFKVSMDYLIYGYDRTQLMNFIDTIQNGRPDEQFIKDTGIDGDELFNFQIGISDERPSIEILKKIASSNPVDYLVDLDDLLEAAGYEVNRKTRLDATPNAERLITEVHPGDMVSLPIVGSVSCGNGVLAYVDIEGYEPTPREWLNGGDYFYTRVKGNSMINARIQNGDLVLIRKQSDVDDGQIAAVVIDEEIFLKRVYKKNGTVILQSENSKFPPMIVDLKNSNCRIVGKLDRVIIKI